MDVNDLMCIAGPYRLSHLIRCRCRQVDARDAELATPPWCKYGHVGHARRQYVGHSNSDIASPTRAVQSPWINSTNSMGPVAFRWSSDCAFDTGKAGVANCEEPWAHRLDTARRS